ncbi:MAG TPA: PilT/PilU family type 4a pilus ATPase [Candidatus Saccharimonadales bacterium]|nr:PilT/PilU family type 4a pilus ATPase [Candidatus Saccharimonadales bacterium]
METFRRILTTALEGGASDIHLKVAAPIIFRINRKLVVVEGPLPTEEWMHTVIDNIVPRHAREQLDREHECDFSYFLPGIGRYRTNCFYQRGTPCLAMRFVKTQVPSFEELGLIPVLKQIAESQRGIVLLAGSTGSGKSTTLAAMLEHINANSRKHIITLEDPIEYVFEDNQSVIEQREIGLDTSSFEHGLKYVLRQDPDVIMIGEMRDAISFSAAMSAADTGHLVLSTLHTTNASQSIGRILDFFKPDERDQIRRQIAGTLQAVVCQRMVPAVAGGMVPAQEIMINSGTVRKLIEENRLEKLGAAIETGGEEGMINFNQHLFQLVKDGKVSQKEALAKATNAQALEMNFQGIFLTEGKRILG